MAGPAAQRHRTPTTRAGCRDALHIQLSCDLGRGLPAGKGPKDAPHDRGFLWHDLAQAPLKLAVGLQPAGDAPVAIRRRPEAAASADTALDPAPGLGGEVLEEQRVHRPLESDMQRADLTLGEGDQPHAGKSGQLVEGGDMLLVAGEPVERLGQDKVEPTLPHRRLQRLETRPGGAGTGEGGILEGGDHCPALTLGVGAADAQLVLDRVLRLPVGGVAGVERDPGRQGVGQPAHGASPLLRSARRRAASRRSRMISVILRSAARWFAVM